MGTISSNSKIAKNTIFLYFRMMFVMGVSLYTSRVNLSVLGIEDNGIYQVVGGLVAMMAFLRGSLSGATSRFLTYEIGKEDELMVRRTFSAALEIHFLLGIFVLIISETVGLWFLENRLVIPENRMAAARVIYQFSILSCIISLIQVPYDALLISYEKMNVFAYLGILDVILKLAICYSLYVIPYDKLIVYGFLMTCVSIINILVYYLYCRKNFYVSRFIVEKSREILKPILNFSGWDLIGNFSVIARSQGINIVMNLFFGPAINSAAGFASSIGNAIYSFANNFMTAIRPPIVKAYSKNEIEKMQELMINASKYSFAVMLLIGLPFIFESHLIVKIWLKTPPEYTAILSSLDLILNLVSTLFIPLMFVIHATGNIKFISIVNGTIWILSVPLSYLVLYMGFSPYSPYIIKLFLLVFVVWSNIYNTKKLVPKFEIKRYLDLAVLPCIFVVLISVFFTFIAHILTHQEIVQFFITTIVSIFTICISVYLILLNTSQRLSIRMRIQKFIK